LPETDWKVAFLSVESPRRKFLRTLRFAKPVFFVLVTTLVLLVAACGGKPSDNASKDSGDQEASSPPEQSAVEEVTVEETTENAASGEAVELARAEVGKKETTNMMPADGRNLMRRGLCPRTRPRG
jgi:hypothetical protein